MHERYENTPRTHEGSMLLSYAINYNVSIISSFGIFGVY